MIKKDRHTVIGIDQDSAPDKRKPDVCYDSENIRIINNGRNLSIKPIGSSTEFVTNATLGASNLIIGSIEINDLLYIFTTDDAGSDRVASINSTGTLTDIITGDFNFSSANRIEAVANFETENIIKIYWTDGVNQLRFVNVSPTGTPSTKINIVEEITLSQPTSTIQQGGSLIGGNIQYVYNLYNVNGSQSVLSTASYILSLTKYMDGVDSGESSGLSTELTIPNIDQDFEYIRIYSIHWQELNQTPKITLIVDEQIASSSLVFYDDGNSFVSELSSAELLSIGGRPLIVGTLAAKRNRLFVANYLAANFNFDIDTRAFAHAISSPNYRVKNIDGSDAAIRTLPTVPVDTHDAVNYDYDTYKYIQSSTTYGLQGINLKIEFSTSQIPDYSSVPDRSLKQNEIYRVGIKFFDVFGQTTPVKWVADIKIPPYYLGGNLNFVIGLSVNLTTAGVTAAINGGAVKYQIVSVERQIWDRTIISQGFIIPGVNYEDSVGAALSPYTHPYYITKEIKDSTSTVGSNIHEDFLDTVDFSGGDPGDAIPSNTLVKDDTTMFFHSSDTMFESEVDSATGIRILGSIDQPSPAATNNYTKVIRYANGVQDNFFVKPGVRTDQYRTAAFMNDGSFPANILAYSLYATGDSIIDTFGAHFYRNYSTFYESANNYEVTLKSPSILLAQAGIKSIDADVTAANIVDIFALSTSDIQASSYYCKFDASIVLRFSTTNWHNNGSIDWGKFAASQFTTDTKIPIVELIRTVTNQYGGASYESRQRNTYLDNGQLAAITDTPVTQYVGDIYVGPLIINRTDSEDDKRGSYWSVYESLYIQSLENNHNVYGRRDNMYDWWAAGFADGISYQNFRLDDNKLLLGAYSQNPNLLVSFPEPVNFNVVDTFPNRIQSSALKFPNELIDSWTNFPENDTLDVEGTYGSITKLYNFKGEVYSLQNSGIAHISINPRVQTQATDGVNIELGIGAVLYDHKYLTTQSGTTDKFTVSDDGQSLFYYDSIYNTINTLADTKISTLSGVRQILENNSGIISTLYNREQDEMMFSFNNKILVYSSLLQKFITKETEYSVDGHLMKLNDSVFFRDASGNIAKKYNGLEYLPTSVTYLFSPAIGTEKVFHNLEYRMYGDIDIENIQVTGNLNSSDLEAVTSKNKFDIRRIHLPRISDTRQRFREPYILVEVQSNTGVTTGDFSLDDMVIMYNIKG